MHRNSHLGSCVQSYLHREAHLHTHRCALVHKNVYRHEQEHECVEQHTLRYLCAKRSTECTKQYAQTLVCEQIHSTCMYLRTYTYTEACNIEGSAYPPPLALPPCPFLSTFRGSFCHQQSKHRFKGIPTCFVRLC